MHTHASILPPPHPPSPPRSCWSKTWHTLAIHILLCRTMPLHSPQRSSRRGVVRGASSISQVHLTIPPPMEQLNVWSRLLSRPSPNHHSHLELRYSMQYRRTPWAEGYSPSELLNGHQIRTRIDILLPSLLKENKLGKPQSFKLKRSQTELHLYAQ